MTSRTSASLQRLLTWLSPAFPVGAFAWSAGLETAIADRNVGDATTLKDWLAGTLAHGGLRTDAIMLAHAHRAGDAAALAALAELYLALTPAAERRSETLVTGEAFVLAARAWSLQAIAPLPDPCPYPIAVGSLAAASGIPLPDALLAFLTATVQSQVSVAVRLVPLGQAAGLDVLAALEPAIAVAADFATVATLDDLGTIAYAADIAQMRHETLEPRIFRS